jgi:hypothetical protein
MPQQFGNLGVGDAVGESVGGKPVAVAVGDDPPQPRPPPGTRPGRTLYDPRNGLPVATDRNRSRAKKLLPAPLRPHGQADLAGLVVVVDQELRGGLLHDVGQRQDPVPPDGRDSGSQPPIVLDSISRKVETSQQLTGSAKKRACFAVLEMAYDAPPGSRHLLCPTRFHQRGQSYPAGAISPKALLPRQRQGRFRATPLTGVK